MGNVKLDRANWSKIQYDSGVPDGTTPGNIYINSTTGKIYTRRTLLSAWASIDSHTTLDEAYINGPTITTASSVDLGFTLTSGDFTVDGTGNMLLGSNTALGTFTLNTSGVIDIDAAGAVTIDSNTNVDVDALEINIGIQTVNDENPQVINIGTGTGLRNITIGNGAGSTDISIQAGSYASGTLDIDAGGHIGINSSSGNINIGTDAADEAINIGTGASARPITIGNSNTTTAVDILSGTGGINLNDGVAQLDMDGAGALSTTAVTTMDLDCSSTLSLNSSAGAINIGNDNNAQAIQIGTGASSRPITIGNNTGTTAVNLLSGTGGVNFHDTVGYMNFDGIGALSTTAVTTMDLDCTGAMSLNSSAGAINIGNDAVNQNINIGTTSAEREITIGNVNESSKVSLIAEEIFIYANNSVFINADDGYYYIGNDGDGNTNYEKLDIGFSEGKITGSISNSSYVIDSNGDSQDVFSTSLFGSILGNGSCELTPDGTSGTSIPIAADTLYTGKIWIGAAKGQPTTGSPEVKSWEIEFTAYNDGTTLFFIGVDVNVKHSTNNSTEDDWDVYLTLDQVNEEIVVNGEVGTDLGAYTVAFQGGMRIQEIITTNLPTIPE